MTATANQLGLLHHTLGVNPERREPYRNHFVAGRGHSDLPDLEALVSAGMMARGAKPGFLAADDIVFRVTDAGRAYALENLPPAPPPRKQSRYEDYLDADGCAGDSFGEFLCGIRLPRFEARDHRPYGQWKSTTQYRMYRQKWDSYYNLPGDRDVQGEWASTKKEAKASYKAALKKRQETQRVERRVYA